MGREHDLKTWPEPFAAVWSGAKRYEIRVNDRGYAVGDLLVLQEYDPRDGRYYAGRYTERAIAARVTYMTPGGQWGLPSHVCVMSIDVLAKTEKCTIGCFDALHGGG